MQDKDLGNGATVGAGRPLFIRLSNKEPSGQRKRSQRGGAKLSGNETRKGEREMSLYMEDYGVRVQSTGKDNAVQKSAHPLARGLGRVRPKKRQKISSKTHPKEHRGGTSPRI